MARSPDGILEAAFDPARNLTRLVVDGGMWPVPGVLRTNLHPDPRATAVGGLWGYQPGTSEVAPTTLMTAASPKRTNHFRNPRAVAGGTSWTQGGATGGSNYTADNIAGWSQNLVPGVTTARRITITNSAAVTSLYFRVAQTATMEHGIPVTPGMHAGCKAVIQTSRSISFRAFMQFYDAAGTFLSSSAATVVTTVAGVSREIAHVGVVPAGAAFMVPYIGQAAAPADQANGDVWLCSAVIDAQANTEASVLALLAEPYFDGDTPNGSGSTHAWTGTANASPSTAAFDDSPVLPDGSRVGTYIRRTVTSIKTGGSSGPFCRTPANTLAIVPGDIVTPTMYVRFSVEVTLTVQSSIRSGSGLVTSTITTRAVPANTWARVGQPVTASAAGDNTQVWATLPVGAVLPVGTTVDQTGGQVERGEMTPYFDGSSAPSGPVIRYWTGPANASASVEELMAGPVSRVLIERSSPGVATEPVRTANGAPAAGGWFLGADDAAPMDTTCTYTVSGLDQYGGLVATSSVTVETTGAAWGPWLKAPGRPQLTVQVPLAQVGDVASPTQGGAYQVPGGGSVPQWSGTDTDALAVSLLPRDESEVARLTALLRAERVLLIQTGEPAEPLLPSGYYFVEGVGRSNPAQVRVDVYGRRVFALQLTATSAPAGAGQGFTGTTYETVRQTYATYQDVVDGNATYFDVYAGEGV
jgi:hypothetical protein